MAKLSEQEIRIYRECVSELIQDKGLQKAYRAFGRHRSHPRLWLALQGAAAAALIAALAIAVIFTTMASYREN
jgi:hypothetical protein